MSALVGRAHIPPLMHAHASDATGLLRSSDGNRCNKSMDNCRTFKLGVGFFLCDLLYVESLHGG